MYLQLGPRNLPCQTMIDVLESRFSLSVSTKGAHLLSDKCINPYLPCQTIIDVLESRFSLSVSTKGAHLLPDKCISIISFNPYLLIFFQVVSLMWNIMNKSLLEMHYFYVNIFLNGWFFETMLFVIFARRL